MKIAVISDIHANLFALEQVFDDMKFFDIDKIFVLGDLVGYYYWPNEVMTRLTEHDNVEMISGNHEKYLFEYETDINRRDYLKEKYGSGFEIASKTLSKQNKTILKKLPIKKDVSISNLSFLLCHGSPQNPEEYIYPDSQKEKIISSLEKSYDFILLGHSHYPFCYHFNNTMIVNPGSVGQPRDHGNLASYAVIDTNSKTTMFRRVYFNTKKIIDSVKLFDPSIAYNHEIFLRNIKPYGDCNAF